jgi:apolipoprotein N-acyltransferase
LKASFPPLGLGPLAFVACWPLFAAVRSRSLARRLGLGALAGMVWGCGTVFAWLYPAARGHLASGPIVASLFTAGAAWAYGGIYLCVLAGVYPWLPRPRWLTVPSAWVLLEAVRPYLLGGAPWALLGQSQIAVLPLAQLAELTGVAGLSFLVVMPAAALAESGRARRRGLAVWAAAVAVAAVFGAGRLARFPAGGASEGVPITVVSGHNLAPDPLAAYRAATAAAPPAALTVWPESAVPRYLQEEPADQTVVAEVARERGWLLFGAPRWAGRGAARRYLNAAYLADPAGRVAGTYAKSLLVPWAERSPWPLPSLVARPFSAGPADPAPLRAAGLRLGVLVCWESVFAAPARNYARRGVDVLVNLTSDRDLGAGALQQLSFSRFRAIETRRWLIRASGTGTTDLVDPAGRVHPRTTLRVAPNHGAPGLYVRWGETVPWFAVAVLALCFAASRYERRVAPRGERRDGVGPAPPAPAADPDTARVRS